MTDEEIKKLKDEIRTWKEASSANSYKAFKLQEENKSLLMHILELQKDKEELTNKCKELEAQIEKMKCVQNCFYGKDEKCFFNEGPFILPNCEYCQNWKEIKEND